MACDSKMWKDSSIEEICANSLAVRALAFKIEWLETFLRNNLVVKIDPFNDQQLLDETEYDMKSYTDRGGCCLPKPLPNLKDCSLICLKIRE